ncbi:MAG: hypothetical protein MJE66_12475 [Proteobacteria bacterium]|nr:hypothetical protein [Pseudomonadota bacterium]
MTDLRDRLIEDVDKLRQVRDELRVKLHLARADARDQWDRLEKSWQHAEARLRVIRDESKESLEEVSEALQLVVDEIRDGYDHLRKLL